jgi:hypothetical protein
VEKVKGNAIRTANKIARAMRFYPLVLRSVPPQLLDIDRVYSRTRYLQMFHLPATHPREESVEVSLEQRFG